MVKMKIESIKLYQNGFMTQPFAFGGEEGVDKFDSNIKYRSSLQNYVIDTGDEIILVDTGMPKETPDIPRNDEAPLYMGEKITDYVTALENLGYKKEDVSKILITHKHDDHTGEIRSFPNAKVFISKIEADSMKLEGDNIVPVTFCDGKYHNFEKSQKNC